MQQPVRETASPHGASGARSVMHHHHHSLSGAGSSAEGHKAANADAYEPQRTGPDHAAPVGMPPQQVFVNPAVSASMVGPAGMVSLESQFQALGFGQGEASSTEPSSSQSNTNNAEEDQDGEDAEEEPVKLFVGQVRQA